ncbi:MAG: tetratricopeptide repeat protein [Pyrinomonadaceae bacterium]
MLKSFVKTTIAAFTVCLFSFTAAPAQTPNAVTPEMRREANDFYQKGDWENSARSYERIIKLEEKNAGAHYRLGMSLLNLKKNKAAEEQFQTALDLSPNNIFALALARSLARQSEKEKTYKVLEATLQFGGIDPATLSGEGDFAAFREEARFKELLKNSDRAVNPCKAAPEFRRFDFWLGEWDVKNPQGVTVGSSKIDLILNDCVIYENWTSQLSSGKSFNIYDATDEKWHQTWVDAKGNLTEFVGGFVDDKLVYIADEVRGGQPIMLRMTFTKLPNGDVRQFGESSGDGGKTWATRYDLTYTRKK